MSFNDEIFRMLDDLDIPRPHDTAQDISEALARRIGLNKCYIDNLCTVLQGDHLQTADFAKLADVIIQRAYAQCPDLDSRYKTTLPHATGKQPSSPSPSPHTGTWEELIERNATSLNRGVKPFQDMKDIAADDILCAPNFVQYYNASYKNDAILVCVATKNAPKACWKNRARADCRLDKCLTDAPRNIRLPELNDAANENNPGWSIYKLDAPFHENTTVAEKAAMDHYTTKKALSTIQILGEHLLFLNDHDIVVLQLNPHLLLQSNNTILWKDPCLVWSQKDAFPEGPVHIDMIRRKIIQAQNFMLALFFLRLRFDTPSGQIHPSLPWQFLTAYNLTKNRPSEYGGAVDILRQTLSQDGSLKNGINKRLAGHLGSCFHPNPNERPDNLSSWESL